jgi:hypothetical protein
MLIDWNNKWVHIDKGGKMVKLQAHPEQAVVQVCEEVNINEELQGRSELMVAQIWLCEAASPTVCSTHPSPELSKVLEDFASVFEPIFTLPPYREIDHKIPLIPNSKPVNLRPYRYSYFQKIELEKIIEEMLKNSIIKPSTSPFSSQRYWLRKKTVVGGYA